MCAHGLQAQLKDAKAQADEVRVQAGLLRADASGRRSPPPQEEVHEAVSPANTSSGTNQLLPGSQQEDAVRQELQAKVRRLAPNLNCMICAHLLVAESNKSTQLVVGPGRGKLKVWDLTLKWRFKKQASA